MSLLVVRDLSAGYDKLTILRELDFSIEKGEVAVVLAEGKTLIATLTKESAEELALKPGDPVTALVKAPHVILAVE